MGAIWSGGRYINQKSSGAAGYVARRKANRWSVGADDDRYCAVPLFSWRDEAIEAEVATGPP